MKKALILLLMFFIAFFSFAGGAQEEKGKEEIGAKKTVLRIGARAWIYKKFPVKDVGEQFMGKNPNIEIKYITVADAFVPIYLINWKEEKPEVDLHLGAIVTKIAPLDSAGLLEDLTDMLTGNMAREKYIKAFLGNCRFKKNGKPYYPIIPFMGEITALDINLNLYRKAGMMKNDKEAIGPPSWDTEEMVAYFRKLGKISPQGYGLGAAMQSNIPNILHGYLNPILAQRGSIYAPDQNVVLDFESKEANHALQVFSRLYKEKLLFPNVSDFKEVLTAYKGGMLPLIQESHSKMVEAAEVLGEDNVSFVMWPGFEKNGTIAFTGGSVIPKNSKNIDQAKKFLREAIATTEFDQWSFNHYGKLPVLKSSYTGLKWFQDQATRIAKIANVSTTEPLYPGDVELRRLMGEFIHPAIMGDITVDEALKKITEQIKERNIDLSRIEYTGDQF